MTDTKPRAIPFRHDRLPREEMVQRARTWYEHMRQRRSIRAFSSDAPPKACIEYAIRTAGTAPSGAHRQPWRFVVIDDPELKRAIRRAAEREERANYESRFPPGWLEALAPLGTDWHKEFLEIAPYLVVVFKETYGLDRRGDKITNYYVNESVGIACGLFIAAVHGMGLVTLTHTPSPMGFLSRLLKRPKNEKPYILFPVGYPADDATVPHLVRKPFEELVQWNDGSTPPT